MILSEHRLPTYEFVTGETQVVKMHEYNGDTGELLDLTDATAQLILCYFEDKSFPLFTKTGTISQARLGFVEFIIDSEDTESLEEGRYLIQRQLVLSDGTVSVVEGEWFLRKGV